MLLKPSYPWLMFGGKDHSAVVAEDLSLKVPDTNSRTGTFTGGAGLPHGTEVLFDAGRANYYGGDIVERHRISAIASIPTSHYASQNVLNYWDPGYDIRSIPTSLGPIILTPNCTGVYSSSSYPEISLASFTGTHSLIYSPLDPSASIPASTPDRYTSLIIQRGPETYAINDSLNSHVEQVSIDQTQYVS